jgi:hypothetical protein
LRYSPGSAGLTEAEGYASSLRQQAAWIEESPAAEMIDADELRAAASFIERQSRDVAQSVGRCICQNQHRRGYCTEPGCPFAVAQRPSDAFLQGVREAVFAKCAEIADKYNDCGGDFIAQKIRDETYAIPSTHQQSSDGFRYGSRRDWEMKRRESSGRILGALWGWAIIAIIVIAWFNRPETW